MRQSLRLISRVVILAGVAVAVAVTLAVAVGIRSRTGPHMLNIVPSIDPSVKCSKYLTEVTVQYYE